MLRLPASSSSARSVALRTAPAAPRLYVTRRAFADAKPPSPPTGKTNGANANSPVIPTLPASKAPSSVSPSPKSATPATPSSSTSAAPTKVPLTPPSPPKIQTSPPQGGALPTKPIAAKKTHRLRNFLLGLTFLTSASFGAGVFYSLKSDNVHDFFTEHVPFGAEAVQYFEEREFRRRFPNALSKINSKPESPKVTIPKSSGASWKIVDDKKDEVRAVDVGKPGPHLSSHKPIPTDKPKESELAQRTVISASEPGAKARVIDVKDAPESTKVKKVEAIQNPEKERAKSVPAPTAAQLETLQLQNVSDPIVADVVLAVNKIIETVNKTGSSNTFGEVIENAKKELNDLNNQISELKSNLETEIQKRINAKDLEFAEAAQGLVKRVNNDFEDIEHRIREEFASERDKIVSAYRRKMQVELTRSRLISEQRMRNELLEQAIEMKRAWINEISDRVEQERNGRLGKLKELENAVQELEKLTLQWNDVVNASLKTQQTFTALEAVTASFTSPDQPRPFLHEMAALREVGEDSEVIRAAIASINPTAYQRGVASQTQLIERFRKVADEVHRAALLPEDAGLAAHVGNWVLSKLMFRKRGLAKGDDVAAILAKAETYLEEGDVGNATREMNQLSGLARTLANDWLKEARLLLEVQQATEVIAAEARIQNLRVQQTQ